MGFVEEETVSLSCALVVTTFYKLPALEGQGPSISPAGSASATGEKHASDPFDILSQGRVAVEGMRQALVEAKWQGIFPFCLMADRHAPGHLPQAFGANQFALLTRPEMLPHSLLNWMKALLTR